MRPPLIFSVFAFWKTDNGRYRLGHYDVAACTFDEAVAAYHESISRHAPLTQEAVPESETFITTQEAAERSGSVHSLGFKEEPPISADDFERWKNNSLFSYVEDGETVQPSWVPLPPPAPLVANEANASLEQRLADAERRLHFIIDQASLEHVGGGVNHWCLGAIVFDAAGEVDHGSQRADIYAAIDAASKAPSPASSESLTPVL